MKYKLNTSGHTVILNVLAIPDYSVVGLSIWHSKIIIMSYAKFMNIASTIMDKQYLRESDTKIRIYFALRDNDKLIVMETIEEYKGLIFEPDIILKMLKLYKSIDIFSCCLISYRYYKNKFIDGRILKLHQNVHPYLYPMKLYQLSIEEKNTFNEWVNNHQYIISNKYNNSVA